MNISRVLSKMLTQLMNLDTTQIMDETMNNTMDWGNSFKDQ